MNPVDIAIVNYNTRDLLRDCLASVLRAAPGTVVVVDHGSTDGSIGMVRGEFPDVVLEVNPANPGYGAGANRAIRRTSAPYVVLLNSDTLLEPGALTALRQYLDAHPRAGLVGPRLRNPDGTLQRSCYHFLTPFQMLVAQTSWLARFFSSAPVLRDHFLPASSHDAARAVPWVKGAALAIRRTAFEAVGGFDETFFMYAEEMDLCYRLKEGGWDTHFAAVTDVVHVEAASTAQQRARMEVKLFDSVHLFYRRHYTRTQLQQLRLVVACVMGQRIVCRTLRLDRATPEERSRTAEDLLIWRRVLADVLHQWGRSALLDDRAHGEPVGV